MHTEGPKLKYNPYSPRESFLYILRNCRFSNPHHLESYIYLVTTFYNSHSVWTPATTPTQSGSVVACTVSEPTLSQPCNRSTKATKNNLCLQMRKKAERRFPQSTGEATSNFLLSVQHYYHGSAILSPAGQASLLVNKHILVLPRAEFLKPTKPGDSLRHKELVSKRKSI